MKDACRRCCCPSRSLLPLLPIVLSPRWGGDRRCCLDLPPVPSRLFSPLPGRKRKCKLGPTRAPVSCAPGTTSITGRRRFPPHVSIMIRLDILFIWGGNHAVRDELQKPRLLISRPILWGFTKYFLTAIRDQIPPPAALPVFSSTHPLAHNRAHLIPSIFFQCTAAGLDDGDCFVVVVSIGVDILPVVPRGVKKGGGQARYAST